MTATTRPLPPLTPRQVAAVDTVGADGRRYAHNLIRSSQRPRGRVNPAELIYARQILSYWRELWRAA